MRFAISRTSAHGRAETQPHPRAFRSEDPWQPWHVDVADMDELLALVAERGPFGEVVLSAPNPPRCPLPGVEIYDDYRE